MIQHSDQYFCETTKALFSAVTVPLALHKYGLFPNKKLYVELC